MRKRNLPRAPLPVIGPVDDPQSLYHQMRPFLEWLSTRHYSEQTVRHREIHLRGFIAWCDERGVTRPQEVTRPVLERYQRYLYLYRKADGQALSARTQAQRMEGAAQVLKIDRRLLGIAERDSDFDKFLLIRSETDHLPLSQQQSLWSTDALEKLQDEFIRTEEWAKTFAPEACKNLARFKQG
jgi:hypothetical protein